MAAQGFISAEVNIFQPDDASRDITEPLYWREAHDNFIYMRRARASRDIYQRRDDDGDATIDAFNYRAMPLVPHRP